MPKQPTKEQLEGMDLLLDELYNAFLDSSTRDTDFNKTVDFSELCTYAYREAMTKLTMEKL